MVIVLSGSKWMKAVPEAAGVAELPVAPASQDRDVKASAVGVEAQERRGLRQRTPSPGEIQYQQQEPNNFDKKPGQSRCKTPQPSIKPLAVRCSVPTEM